MSITERFYDLDTLGLQEKDLPFTSGFKGKAQHPSEWTMEEREIDNLMDVTTTINEDQITGFTTIRTPWLKGFETRL